MKRKERRKEGIWGRRDEQVKKDVTGWLAVGERGKQVEKDVMDWTVVRRNKRQRKRTVQIFVKVNGSKVTPMEVNLTDDKVEDVMRQIQKDEAAYVTVHGKVLKRSE